MPDPVNCTASNAAVPLGDVATLRSGYAFRNAIPEHPEGRTLVLQLKDIADGQPNWAAVARTNLARSPSSDEWLNPGDILFTFRGTRYVALALEEVPPQTIAGTQFMILRVREPRTLLPAFLAWQLNQPPAQRSFAEGATGTAQRSLRRNVIETVQVAVPSIEVQQSIVDLVELTQRERRTLEELIQVRSELVSAIASSLMDGATGESR